MGKEYKDWLTQVAAATNNKEKQRGWQPTRNKVGAWMTQISWYIANSVATTVEASADMAEVPREDDAEAWEQWHDVRNQARARMQEEEEKEEEQCTNAGQVHDNAEQQEDWHQNMVKLEDQDQCQMCETQSTMQTPEAEWDCCQSGVPGKWKAEWQSKLRRAKC